MERIQVKLEDFGEFTVYDDDDILAGDDTGHEDCLNFRFWFGDKLSITLPHRDYIRLLNLIRILDTKYSDITTRDKIFLDKYNDSFHNSIISEDEMDILQKKFDKFNK